jgi:3-isopropylmalate/(R)-2-methylmalate dehydratase small subunit
MEPFTRVCGTVVPLQMPNINTDALAPGPWNRDHPDDPGGGLLWNYRHAEDGTPLAEFPLNKARYRDARILIAGANFGCGSSRETAVWAVLGFGIRCVIAPSFSDNYPDSAFQNGLLCVVLPSDEVTALASRIEAMEEPSLCVDLHTQTIEDGDDLVATFLIAEDRRAAMLEGMDQTMILRRKEDAIAAFRAADLQRRPWIYDLAPD